MREQHLHYEVETTVAGEMVVGSLDANNPDRGMGELALIENHLYVSESRPEPTHELLWALFTRRSRQPQWSKALLGSIETLVATPTGDIALHYDAASRWYTVNGVARYDDAPYPPVVVQLRTGQSEAARQFVERVLAVRDDWRKSVQAKPDEAT